MKEYICFDETFYAVPNAASPTILCLAMNFTFIKKHKPAAFLK